MTKEEFDRLSDCFDPQIRLVVELPNGQQISVKTVDYEFGTRSEAVLVLKTDRPTRR